jgi:hypothetical protein
LRSNLRWVWCPCERHIGHRCICHRIRQSVILHTGYATYNNQIRKIADIRITVIYYGYVKAYRNVRGDFHTTVERNNDRVFWTGRLSLDINQKLNWHGTHWSSACIIDEIFNLDERKNAGGVRSNVVIKHAGFFTFKWYQPRFLDNERKHLRSCTDSQVLSK